MDKVIPFNKGIRRQPSLGEAGELSECVNLIPQNGELVNVRGMDKVASGIEGTVIAIHKVDESTHIFTIDGNSIRIYKDYSLIETYTNYENKDVISSSVVGNVVIISGVGSEYMYFLYTNGRYHYFKLSQFIINTSVTCLSEGVVQSFTGDPKDVLNNQISSDKSKFTGVTFGIIGLKSYTNDYFYYSDIFVLDNNCGANGYYRVGTAQQFYASIMSYDIECEHSIPDELISLTTSVDLFLTTSTYFRNDDGTLKDSESMAKEMLDAGFYLSVSTPLESV
jgi:hypothetical protein